MERKTVQYLSLALFFGLLAWGLYTLIVYFGIPVHGAVLLDKADQEHIKTICSDSQYLCRGAAALIPSITNTIVRARPFLSYFIVSALLYACFLGWYAMKTGNLQLRLSLKPWHIFALFIGSLWLLFTVLTAMNLQQSEGVVSFRRLIEPHPSVYQNAGQQALEHLQDNFESLHEKGCLTLVREIRPEVREFRMTSICVQGFFFSRVIMQVLFVLMLIMVSLTAGRALLQLMRLRASSVMMEAMLSLGLGVCAWIVLLWLMAVFGILINSVAWTALVLVLLVGYKHARYWLLVFATHTWQVDRKWHSVSLIFAWLLISYLAFNFLTVIRPFPIGWDDLGSYVNRPRLMVSYGKFIPSMAPFQWEYLTSLGFLLYGYESVFGATASMLVNWFAGLFAVLAIMVFTSTFLGSGTGVLTALLYYTLPLVGHFSFADMKTDNAVFAFQALALLCAFVYLFRPEPERDGDEDAQPSPPQWQWLALAGIFCGLAFGTKITAAMVLMAIGAIILGTQLHWLGYVGSIFLGFAAYVLQGSLNVHEVMERVGWGMGRDAFIVLLLVLGLGCIAGAVGLRTKRATTAFRSVGIFLASFAVCILPWIVHNNILSGSYLPKFQLKAPNYITPSLDLSGTVDHSKSKQLVRSLPSDLAVDLNHPQCTSTSREEELGRYWGSRQGWTHYLTLPWRTVMNIDSAGYYVTTSPSLLLFPLLLLLPFFWLRGGRWLRWLFLGTVFLLLQWMFLANGVPWYGIGVFTGLVVGLEVLLVKAPDTTNRGVVGILLAIALISCFAMRFWQFEQQRNLLEYTMGKTTAAVMRERTIPHYDDISEEVMRRHERMPERPYLYRVGTFIPYFIPRNLEVIGIADHQLDKFNCMAQENDNQLILKRLKALGFNSIIFDTNTATIERDPNGSLHQKVRRFLEFVNDPTLGLQIVVNDTGAGVAFLLLP